MNEQRLEQAADWLDRIDHLDQQEQRALALWLQCPENKKAFEKMASVFGDPKVKQQLHHTLQQQTNLSVVNTATKRFNSFSGLALAASFCAIAFLLYWFTATSQPNTQTPIAQLKPQTSQQLHLSADIGQPASTLLTDGSYLHLNANSDLTAQIKNHTREIQLTKGQVFFDVAKDKTRPFIIHAGQANITVLGTSFDVERSANKVTITVYQGSVKVSAEQEVVLIPPQQAVVEQGHIRVTNNVELGQLPAWRTGWLEANNEPLTHVIAQLQRYSKAAIQIDHSLNNALISGRFKLQTPQQSVKLIAASYNWQVAEKNNTILLTPH